jgi:uncharacterized protein YndB with AHSA1/START domain
MTVITSSTNAEDLSMTVVAEFDAAPERLWDVWRDPRKLERWFGPPSHPATVTRYEFERGGQCRYHMTGPDGSKHHGWWQFDELDKPHRIEITIGFARDDGEPVPGAEAGSWVVTFERIESGTRMTVRTQFVDTEHMERMIEGGMEQGLREAIGQIDALLEPVHAA